MGNQSRSANDGGNRSDHQEERRQLDLSDDQIERIAERSAEIVWENFQLEVGKVTVRSVLHIAWIASASLVLYLWATGKIKLL